MSAKPAVTSTEGSLVCFEPIGHVELVAAPSPECTRARAGDSRIVLRAELTDGLDGLHPGRHVQVLYYFHRSSGYELIQHPRGDPSRPRRGVFALRSPNRPNPIGSTLVEVLEVVGSIAWVRGLDALEGSPVLDLKPAGEGNSSAAAV